MNIKCDPYHKQFSDIDCWCILSSLFAYNKINMRTNLLPWEADVMVPLFEREKSHGLTLRKASFYGDTQHVSLPLYLHKKEIHLSEKRIKKT